MFSKHFDALQPALQLHERKQQNDHMEQLAAKDQKEAVNFMTVLQFIEELLGLLIIKQGHGLWVILQLVWKVRHQVEVHVGRFHSLLKVPEVQQAVQYVNHRQPVLLDIPPSFHEKIHEF